MPAPDDPKHAHAQPLSSGALMLLAGCLGHAANFLFQILMSRMLQAKGQFADYGVMNTMLSIFGLFSIPAGALQLSIARQTAIFDEKHDDNSIAAMLQRAARKVVLLCLALAMVLLALSPWVKSYLKLTSYEPIFVTIGLIVVGMLLAFGNGALQGLKRFGWLSAATAAMPVVRIALGVALVAIGWKASGALLGTLAGNLFMLIVCVAVVRSYFGRTVSLSSVDTSIVYRYLGPTLVCLISYATLVNIDMSIVRHYHPDQAAQYSAAVLFGRAVGWLIAPLCAVMFPHVWDENQQESNRALLLKFLLVAIGLGVAGAVACTVGSGLLTLLMLKREDEAVRSLIPLCAWAMLPIGVANVFLNFVMARGRYGFLVAFIGITLLYLGAFYIWHDSLRQILAVVAAFGIVTLCLFVALTYGTQRAKQP